MAMHGVRADHEALGDLRVAEALRDKPEHLSLARAELIQRVGSRLAGRGRRLDAKERGDRAQDSVTVAMPWQVSVTGQRHELGTRQQRGDLACASHLHRAIVLTMQYQRRRTWPRQVLAHVRLVD